MGRFNSTRIAVIGLGYVGLPLAAEFSKIIKTIGFDIDKSRIKALKSGIDNTRELDNDELKARLKGSLELTDNPKDIADANVFIITVPTPIDGSNNPDLGPLKKSSKLIGQLLKKNDIVIYESTTFPGCTEEICVPILEHESSLNYNKDFYCGYSPERINPGDKVNTLTSIVKVTSGSNSRCAQFVDELYASIIPAGTFRASSIAVAEASKAIENAQRDLNISFVNEIALIFDKLGIDTREVLDAARTKWNFLNYSPGLVGGHCIGVDPYYLAYKAQIKGYNPEVILAGRRTNDSIGPHIATSLVKIMISKSLPIKDSKVLVLGITFKENCPDIRNTKVISIIKELTTYGIEVDVYDPWADSKEVMTNLSIKLESSPDLSKYDGVILAVAHDEFSKLEIVANKTTAVFDVKGVLPKSSVDKRL